MLEFNREEGCGGGGPPPAGICEDAFKPKGDPLAEDCWSKTAPDATRVGPYDLQRFPMSCAGPETGSFRVG
jgi:hypothetical protein